MQPFNPRKNFVPSSGQRYGCKVAIIGEAPGEQENLLGAPFVGTSGNLLMHMLKIAGISTADVYITNVIKEQPEKNNISLFIDMKKRPPRRTSEYDVYEALLYEELRNCTANVFVPLGNVALYSLTRLTAIGKWRGSILQAVPELDSRKVIPTIHPAAALRTYLARYPIINDLMRVSEELHTPAITLPQRTLRIRPLFCEAMSYLDECSRASEIAYDIEVNMQNYQVSCISFALTPTDCMSIPFTHEGGDYYSLDQEVEIWSRIAAILQNPRIRKIGQNLAFDTCFLFRRYGIITRNIGDSMVAQAIICPDFPKGLDYICSVYTREPYYKDEGKKYMKLGGSYDNFWLYNAKDSAICLEAHARMLPELERSGNSLTYARQLELIEPLTYMQIRGIRMDVEGIKRANEEAKQQIEQLTTEFKQLCGYDINPASPAQLKEYFYERKKIKPYVDRKTGQPTTGRDALKRLSRRGFREAQLLLKLRTLTKLRNTYFEVELDSDHRLRCSYNPVGTSTGRISSSKTIFDTGMNLQNQPPAMKRFMLADEGCVMFDVDLEQAENRAVAYIAPEPTMIAAFESGVDIHCLTAGLLFNKAPYEISDEKGSSSLGSGDLSERDWGKRANHGLNYGLGYSKFAFMYEMPESEAKRIVDRYHQVYPGVRRYHAWVRAQIETNRTLMTPFGRTRKFLDRLDADLFQAANAFIPQSLIAEKLNQDGLVYLYKRQDLFAPVDLLNQIHDSLLFQIPIAVGWHEIARCLLNLRANIMTPIQWRSQSFSIPAGCKMGLNAGKCKHERDGSLSNPSGMRSIAWDKCSIDTLAAELERTYAELVAPAHETSLLASAEEENVLVVDETENESEKEIV